METLQKMISEFPELLQRNKEILNEVSIIISIVTGNIDGEATCISCTSGVIIVQCIDKYINVLYGILLLWLSYS